jgi:hypothetical protein
MPYDVQRSAAFGRSERETLVLLQLDRPVLADDLATIATPRRAAFVPHVDVPVPGDNLDDLAAIIAPRRAAPVPQLARPARGDDATTVIAPRRAAPVGYDGKPVFSDDSGRRAAVMRWAGRGICLLGVLLCAALGLTLRAHVSVPGLEGLFGSNTGIRQAPTVPSDTSGASAARPTELRTEDSDRAGATTQPVPRSERTPGAVATSDTQPTAGIPTGEAAPAPVTADPLATVPAVPGSSASKASPPALGKTKPRNPHAATPTPGGHGRPTAVS